MNDVQAVSLAILAEAEKGVSLKAAARKVKANNYNKCLRVMEQIGSWPSSEPELAALQSVWP